MAIESVPKVEKMKSIGLRFSAALVAMAAAIPFAAHGKAQTLRLSSFEPPSAAITANVLTPWANSISKGSNGTLQVVVYAGGALGKSPAQQLKLVINGVADIAWIVPSYTPGRFQGIDVVALPFLSDRSMDLSMALWRLYQRGEFAGFDNLKVLALAVTPPVKIHSRQPIRDIASLKGKKIRVAGDDILVRVAEQLGGVPVALSASEVADALSRGIVDATLNGWSFVKDFKVDEVARYHLNVPLGGGVVMVAMRKSTFDRLPEGARAALEKSSGESLSRAIAQEFDRIEGEYAKSVESSGKGTVYQLTNDQRQAWASAVEPAISAWRKADPGNEKLFNLLNVELRKIRAGQ